MLFSFACWSYFFSLCCFPPHFFLPTPKEISEALLEILTGSEYPYAGYWPVTELWQVGSAAAAPQIPLIISVHRPKGFCVLRELQEEIGHCVSSRGMVIHGAVMGSARHVAALSDLGGFFFFPLTSQRAGFLLKINAPHTANSDSFAMNHFQKWIATVFLEWLLWNPSIIMAGFPLVLLSERISQPQNETSSLKRKKVFSIQKAKVFPASHRRTVTEDLCTYI